jgi:AcrR family transcriptional regulator
MARPARPGAREALLDAARAEFTRAGVARARVEDIARRAGLSKGAFYLHFETKEDAFDALLQRLFGALEDQARRSEDAAARFEREHAGLRGPDLLEAQITFQCGVDTETLETLWRNRDMLALLDASGPRAAALATAFRRRMHALTAAGIAEKQAAGLLRPDVDPGVAADVFVGTYEGLARRMTELREKPDLLSWTRSFLAVIFGGLRHPAPGAACPAPPQPTPSPRRRRRAVS